MEMGMVVSKAKNRLRNTHSKRLKDLILRLLEEILILRRIASVWDKHNALTEAQHFRSDRGCSAALLHFQAALGTAQESGTDIYMSSWDIQRANCSPSKTEIKLAWMRMGIPHI